MASGQFAHNDGHRWRSCTRHPQSSVTGANQKPATQVATVCVGQDVDIAIGKRVMPAVVASSICHAHGRADRIDVVVSSEVNARASH